MSPQNLFEISVLILGVIVLWVLYGFVNHFLILRKVRSEKFPKRYEEHLVKIPIYNTLPVALQEKLKPLIWQFILEKEFIGIKKDVTMEMKTVISFFACLMVVNREDNNFSSLHTIMVYPYEFLYDQQKSYDGVTTVGKSILEGQSSSGVIVLSWHSLKKEAYHVKKHNVVIHELAHVLDFEDGVADGMPVLEDAKYSHWAQVMFSEFEKLNEISLKNREWGKYKILGEYAATNQAEFFAVLSELYFDSPQSLKTHFPDIYEELKRFYKIDMLELSVPVSAS